VNSPVPPRLCSFLTHPIFLLFAKMPPYVRLSVPELPEGECRANKILFGIRMCTYKVDRDKKRNGLEDLGEAKWGLTRCGKEGRGRRSEFRGQNSEVRAGF